MWKYDYSGSLEGCYGANLCDNWQKPWKVTQRSHVFSYKSQFPAYSGFLCCWNNSVAGRTSVAFSAFSEGKWLEKTIPLVACFTRGNIKRKNKFVPAQLEVSDKRAWWQLLAVFCFQPMYIVSRNCPLAYLADGNPCFYSFFWICGISL